MRLRKFTAPDMQGAMQMVREALGDQAIIIHTSQGKTGPVEVTAAVDAESVPVAQPNIPPPSRNAEEEIVRVLRFHNTPEPLIATLLDNWQRQDQPHPHAQLEALIAANFRFQPLSLEREGGRWALIGPPGIGKTLTAAKLASELALKKHEVCVATTDNTKAGGIEQLRAFTDILGIGLKVAPEPGELWQWLQECPPKSRVVIDTAGCNAYLRDDMKELRALIEIGGFEPVMVLPAGGDASEAADIARAFALPGVKRLLITRVDAARRFGSLLAAAHATGIAFCHASASARIAGGLKEMSPSLLSALLVQYRLQT